MLPFMCTADSGREGSVRSIPVELTKCYLSCALLTMRGWGRWGEGEGGGFLVS